MGVQLTKIKTFCSSCSNPPSIQDQIELDNQPSMRSSRRHKSQDVRSQDFQKLQSSLRRRSKRSEIEDNLAGINYCCDSCSSEAPSFPPSNIENEALNTTPVKSNQLLSIERTTSSSFKSKMRQRPVSPDIQFPVQVHLNFKKILQQANER